MTMTLTEWFWLALIVIALSDVFDTIRIRKMQNRIAKLEKQVGENNGRN